MIDQNDIKMYLVMWALRRSVYIPILLVVVMVDELLLLIQARFLSIVSANAWTGSAKEKRRCMCKSVLLNMCVCICDTWIFVFYY